MNDEPRRAFFLLSLRFEPGDGFGPEMRPGGDAYAILELRPEHLEELEWLVNDAERLRQRYGGDYATLTVETGTFELRHGRIPDEGASPDGEGGLPVDFDRTLRATLELAEGDGMGYEIDASLVEALEAADLLEPARTVPVRGERLTQGTFFTFDARLGGDDGERHGALSISDLRMLRLGWADTPEEVRERFRDMATHHPRTAIRCLEGEGVRDVSSALEPEDLKDLLGHDLDEIREAAFFAAGAVSSDLVRKESSGGGRSR